MYVNLPFPPGDEQAPRTLSIEGAGEVDTTLKNLNPKPQTLNPKP
jgi:hypothetical protein